jgi:hypothetical protein
MNPKNKRGNEPAFPLPKGNENIDPSVAGLTTNEYARIAFAAALMSVGKHESFSDILIPAINFADQMFPTK